MSAWLWESRPISPVAMSDAGATIPELICKAENPDRLAFVDGDLRLTFGAFEALCGQIAANLSAQGVAAGSRVVLVVPDGAPLAAVLFACARLGAIAVPLNWRLSADEIAANAAVAKPVVVVVSTRFLSLAQGVVAPLLVLPPDPAQALAVLAGDPAPPPPDAARPFEPWLMLFTSGTTGQAKGCLLSQAGQVAAAASVAAARGAGPDHRLLSTAPLFHVGGLGLLLAHACVGAATVFAPQPLSAAQWLDLLDREGCTSASLAPTLREDVLRLLEARDPPGRLKCLSGPGTTMIDAAAFRALYDRFGERMVVGYGLTEAGNSAAHMSGSEQLDHLDACGRVLSHLEAKVVDQSGRSLPAGEVGELCLRGPSVMLGYWEDLDATAETLKDGWLWTGDLFSLDETRRLRFAGRRKDLIKSGGENVSPAEVERALLSHPAIADCAVCGVPDPRWGEAVKAFIVIAPGQELTALEAIGWSRKHIAGFKRPRYVEFVEALPRSQLGKLDRRALAARPVTDAQAV